MIGVFKVLYFGVRSKTNTHTHTHTNICPKLIRKEPEQQPSLLLFLQHQVMQLANLQPQTFWLNSDNGLLNKALNVLHKKSFMMVTY